MSSRTCAYVASQDDPESWHGTDSSTFLLNRDPQSGGLGITEWYCPHPPLERDDSSDDDQYCVFHTDPAEIPDDVDMRETLLEALEDASDGPRADRPEHRGQFVGATFGAINLSGLTIAATDDQDVRFDHVEFQADDGNLDFTEATFITEGQYPISFAGTEFITDGDVIFNNATFRADAGGDVWFKDATFRTSGNGDVGFSNTTFRTNSNGDVAFSNAMFGADGNGHVWFKDATFRTTGYGNLIFNNATFRTDVDGEVWFKDATFRTDDYGNVVFRDGTFQTNGDGHLQFSNAMFRANGNGHVWFKDATFRTDGNGIVVFRDTTFRADGDGDVWFVDTTFQTDGDGDVWFKDATFRTDGEGDVVFRDTTFRTDGDGDVGFVDVTLANADFRHVEFAEADLRGVDLTGTDLREANITDISLNGATTCKRLNEGDEHDSFTPNSSIPAGLKRKFSESDFDSEAWDATARAYHQLKTVFGEHGLVGKARAMHVRERRARSLEAKATNGWSDHRYLRSLPSRLFTGYGVQVRYLVVWMVLLFLVSTLVYMNAGIGDTFTNNVSYSVLAFTVAPPRIPSGVVTQIVMMVETFFGTFSIVLLGYILSNRERF